MNAELLDVNGDPIPHLYGAGEFGFIASLACNGGHNTGDCTAMERIAGRNAAAEKDPLSELKWETVEVPEEPGMEDFGDDPYMTFQDSGNDYIGVYNGMSPITVKVTMDGDKIGAIECVDFRETSGIGGVAKDVIISQIVEKQQIMVDAYTGATTPSNGIMGAVANALREDSPQYIEAYDEAKAAKASTGAKRKG